MVWGGVAPHLRWLLQNLEEVVDFQSHSCEDHGCSDEKGDNVTRNPSERSRFHQCDDDSGQNPQGEKTSQNVRDSCQLCIKWSKRPLDKIHSARICSVFRSRRRRQRSKRRRTGFSSWKCSPPSISNSADDAKISFCRPRSLEPSYSLWRKREVYTEDPSSKGVRFKAQRQQDRDEKNRDSNH